MKTGRVKQRGASTRCGLVLSRAARSTSAAPFPPLGDTTLTYRNGNGLAWMASNPLTRRTRDFFDREGNTTQILGWMTGQTLPDTPGVYSTYNYTYDKAGDLLSSTDPLNHTTTYGYNAVNEQTSVTNPLGDATTYGYDNVGNLASITDPLGHAVAYSYKAANEKTSRTDALGNKTSYNYDAAGELTSVTDPMGIETAYTYNSRGEVDLKQIYDQSALISNVSYSYCPCGCLNTVSTVIVWDADGDGDPGDPNEGAEGGWRYATISYSRNADDEVTQVTDAMGNVTNLTYDKNGNLTSVTDAKALRVNKRSIWG